MQLTLVIVYKYFFLSIVPSEQKFFLTNHRESNLHTLPVPTQNQKSPPY